MITKFLSLRSYRNMSVAAKLVLPIVVVALVLAITSFVVINKVQRSAAETQAAKNASAVVGQMIATRSAYTGNVVGKLKGDEVGVGFSTDFAEREGFAPLPATLVHKISEIVNQNGAYSIDLISPWPINKEKGPRDDWESLALNELVGDPSSAFSEVKIIDGRETLRYASADFAGVEACVTCHNTHPESPRTDFEVGEMMGALVVEMPVDEKITVAEAIPDLTQTYLEGLSSTDYDASEDAVRLGMAGQLSGYVIIAASSAARAIYDPEFAKLAEGRTGIAPEELPDATRNFIESTEPLIRELIDLAS